MYLKLCLFLTIVSGNLCIEQRPPVIATKGDVWPKPQKSRCFDDYYTIKRPGFEFKTIGSTCSLVKDALNRYRLIIDRAIARVQNLQKSVRDKFGPHDESSDDYAGPLNILEIRLVKSCNGNEYPYMEMDESYKLEIGRKGGKGVLKANTVWGFLRGLETFAQLIHLNSNYNYVIKATDIDDFPRFAHRGLLLDTSRHYLPVDTIFENLEAMACNKLNVFHWHIVDDQSFPYQSTRFPELSKQGAYHSYLKIYTQKDVKDIIEFARVRGIRVVVEFDTPGHTRSWGGVKKILTACYEKGKPNGSYGPMNPTEPYLYIFLKELFDEIIRLFPDKYLHLGGDEVNQDCWKNNPEVRRVMKEWKIRGNFKKLEQIHIEKLHDIIGTRRKTIVWQEVFSNGARLNKDTIVHVWSILGYIQLKQVVSAGQPAIFSSCWYLDDVHRGGDWDKFYVCDPYLLVPNRSRHLLKGGEACMWGENVNEHNVVSRVWPRASAVAEKLWSEFDADTLENCAPRLEEHTCRMNSRGISAQPPNDAGFCLL